MNKLIIQNSNTENFCGITIVTNLYIKYKHKTQEREYPLDFSLFLLKKDSSRSKKIEAQRKFINILTLNMSYLYNLSEKIYGPNYERFWLDKGAHRILDFNIVSI